VSSSVASLSPVKWLICLIVDDFKDAKSTMFNRLPERINIMVGSFYSLRRMYHMTDWFIHT